MKRATNMTRAIMETATGATWANPNSANRFVSATLPRTVGAGGRVTVVMVLVVVVVVAGVVGDSTWT